MNAFGVGAMASTCVGVVVVIVGAVPGAAARWRTRRRLVAAPRAGAVEAIVARVAEDIVVSGGTCGRWARSVSGRARRSTVAVRWRRASGGQRRRADRSVPLLLESVARELRAGASLQGALLVATSGVEADLGPGDPATSTLATALARGISVGDAVTAWVGEEPTPARHLAGTALIVAAQTGGATAVVIDGVADTLRDRVALEREVAALSSQARASALLLVVAPVVVAALAASADDRIAAFLLGRPAGWACILSGLLLDAIGATWIHLTIRQSS